MLIPRGYQEELSDVGLQILRTHALLYLAWEERTGKSLTAILIAEKADIETVLIITKKGKPYDGWIKALQDYPHKRIYKVINYHSAHLALGKYDLIILDEAHNYISGYPKRSTIWSKVRTLTKGRPIIYLSATPKAQGSQLLYNQLSLSDWSPFNKYSTFYSWFETYGIPKQIKIGDKWVNQYNKVKEDLIVACTEHLFISRTRKELNFTHEPKDIIHYVNLSEKTKELYNLLLKDRVLNLDKIQLVADTTIKLRTSLHMLEGGVLKTVVTNGACDKKYDVPGTKLVKIQKEKIKDVNLCHLYFTLGNCEKIAYILDNWGDTENVAIMYNYIAEEHKLRSFFKNAQILQATTNAEGVELSHVRHLIIYSQDFSTARHTQRRARQASEQRAHPIDVHFLLVKKGISDQVYKTVSINKRNYVDSVFIKEFV